MSTKHIHQKVASLIPLFKSEADHECVYSRSLQCKRKAICHILFCVDIIYNSIDRKDLQLFFSVHVEDKIYLGNMRTQIGSQDICGVLDLTIIC